jgi:predicted component of type VI protein secretion system
MHPDPSRARQISRWHFELRRVPDGLRLRTLSEGLTTIDGERVEKGADVPVRSGTRIGVANTLTLRLAGGEQGAADEENDRTMMIKADPGH